jgi:hypothetical protein
VAFISAQKSRVLVGDFAFSPYTAQIDAESPTDMLDFTVVTDTAKAFLPGQDTSTVGLSGWLDVDATSNAQFDQLNDLKAATSPEPFTYGPNGLALTSEVWMAGVNAAQFTTGAAVADKVTWALNMQATGSTDRGVSLKDLSAVTVDTNGTGVDGTAQSTSGGIAHLHVTAFSGFSGAVFTIADSADNSSFATIGTFTTATGPTSERLAISGTVRRYVRYAVDVTGTGSVTFAVAFARK